MLLVYSTAPADSAVKQKLEEKKQKQKKAMDILTGKIAYKKT